MATSYIMPLGFVERPTETGATFILTNPEDSLNLTLDTPITIWRYSPEQLAIGRLRGRVNAVGYTTAIFTTVEYSNGPRWPEDLSIIRPAAPVFLALEESFEPDPERKLTPDQAEAMRRLALRYAELAGTTAVKATEDRSPV